MAYDTASLITLYFTVFYTVFISANFAPFKLDFHTDDMDNFGITGTPANFIAVSNLTMAQDF
jgi:hypothetical protein